MHEATTIPSGSSLELVTLSIMGFRPRLRRTPTGDGVAQLEPSEWRRLGSDLRLGIVGLQVEAQLEAGVQEPIVSDADRTLVSSSSDGAWAAARGWGRRVLPIVAPVAGKLEGRIRDLGDLKAELVEAHVDASLCWAHDGPIPGDRTEFLEASRARMRRELS